MADTKRQDSKGRILRNGESQLNDKYGRYTYRYMQDGKQKTIYLQDTRLLKNIDYIDSEEEGAEPEPNSIVYFEKAE